METVGNVLQELAGLNFTFLYDDFDRSRLLTGIANTIALSAACIILSLAMGVAGAYAITARVPVAGKLTELVVRFCRNTPPLLILYLCFFGLATLAVRASGGHATWLVGGGFAWATIAISLYIGAFNVESLRAGIEAVSPSLAEAGSALGLSRIKTFALIVLPLGFRIALPSLTNNLVELVKTTAYGYAVGVAEVLYVSSQIWADNLNVIEMMITLFAIFMLLVGAVVFVMNRIERRLRLVSR